MASVAALVTVVALVALVALAGFQFAIVPAAAGDAIAQFELEDSEQTAEPGETVTVDVRLATDGGYAGEGIESYAFVVAVPPEVGEPTAVEPGPFLEQDGGAVNQTVTDAGEGAIRIEHERVDAEDGVTGAEIAATVTVEVREDAPAADAEVLVADPGADLHGSEFPMRSFGDNATIAVGGGGEQLEPAYVPGDDADSGGSADGESDDENGVGVVTAEEANRSVDPESGGSDDADGSDGGTDPTPGLGIAAAVAGVLAWSLLAIGIGRRED